MGIFDGFAEAFNPAYQSSLARWQQQQNADREFALQKERHDAAMAAERMRIAALQESQARERNYFDQVPAAIDASQYGLKLPPASAVGQANAFSQDTDSDQPLQRGAKLTQSGLTRRLADAALSAGKINVGQYMEADAAAREYDKKDRKKAFFEKYKNVPDEQLVNIPELRALLNDNPKVKGAVGYDAKTKKFVVSDYNGEGKAEPMSRAEIMDAAMQLFDESEGDVDLAIQRGRTREDRTYNRARQGVQDTNAGMKTAHSMNVDEMRLGVDRARLGLAYKEDSRASAAQKKLDEQLRLGQEAEGYAQGYLRAKGLGKEGDAARSIYDELYRGASVRAAGLGQRLPLLDPKAPVEYKTDANGNIITPDGIYVPDSKSPSGYRKVNLGPSAVEQAIAAKLAGRSGVGVPQQAMQPGAAEIARARAIQNMDDATFNAYQKDQRGEPTSPYERALLMKAGIPLSQ